MRGHELPITELSPSIHTFYGSMCRRLRETEHFTHMPDKINKMCSLEGLYFFLKYKRGHKKFLDYFWALWRIKVMASLVSQHL